MGPLNGTRVLDLSRILAGPWCTQILADLGAEVIKVEPLEGDNTRRLVGAGAGFYAIFNRNQRSIGLDLSKPEARAVLRDLARTAEGEFDNLRGDLPE